MKSHLNAILLLIISFASICVNADHGLAGSSSRSKDFVLLAAGLNGTANGGANSTDPIRSLQLPNLTNASRSPKAFDTSRIPGRLQEPDLNQAAGPAQVSNSSEISQAAQESGPTVQDDMSVKGVENCYNCTMIIGGLPV